MVGLFVGGFLQVSLVAINTVLITRQHWAGVFVVSFFISLFWSFNVKRVAFGGAWDRIVYALGAACGGLAGLALGLLISKI